MSTVAGYFGPKGRGKTTLALADCARLRRLLVYDLKSDDAMTAGLEQIADPGQLYDRLYAAGDTGRFRIAWRGFAAMGDVEGFELANRYAWALGNLTVFWDDADSLLPPGMLRGEARKILKMGNANQVSTVYTAQRPALLPKDFTNNADRLVTFRCHEPRDLDYFSARMGEDAAPIRDLPDWHYLDWIDGQGVRIKKNTRR